MNEGKIIEITLHDVLVHPATDQLPDVVGGLVQALGLGLLEQFALVLDLADRTVSDVMTHRGNVVLVMQAGDKKNPDILLYRIDSAGRVFQ